MVNIIPQITADEVKYALDIKENSILIDVRTPAEVMRGKIPDAINLPIDEIRDKIQTIIPDKNQKIYVYCLSGTRSDTAVSTMIALGYTNVFSMTNGLLRWRFKQYPITI